MSKESKPWSNISLTIVETLYVDYVGIARHVSDYISFPRVLCDIDTAAVDAFK